MAIAARIALSQDDVKRLTDKLSGLADKFARKVMARAMREAAKIMLAEYKSNLSRMQDTGHMMDSAEIRPMKRKRGRFAVGTQVVNDAKTWEKPGRKRYGKYSFPYPFVVEYGHRIGKRPKSIEALHKKRSALKVAGYDTTEITRKIENLEPRKRYVPGKFPMTRAFDATAMRARARIFEIADEGVRNIQRTLAAEAGVG